MLQAALANLQAALTALDQADAPAQIGALVEMAVDQLRDTIAATQSAQSGREIVATAEK